MNLTLMILKSKIVFHALFTKKSFFLLPLATVPVLIEKPQAISVLLAFMVADFATGVLASWEEKKQAEKRDPALRNQNLISSEKLKKSGLKFFLYASTILLAHWLEKVFFIKSFGFSISDSQFTITIATISWWIMVEAYSILFENLKRLGVDLLKIFRKIKAIKNDVLEK